MQGTLSIERMCYLTQVSGAGFYRSLAEQMPVLLLLRFVPVRQRLARR